MTSNLASIEPPLHTGNRSFPLPSTRTASHDLQQTPRSWPRQSLNPTPNAPASSQDAFEPAPKRQKIGDPDTNSIGQASGAIPGILDVGSATSSKGALLVTSASSLPDRANGDREQQPSQFPIRPGKTARHGSHQQSRALAMERANTRDVVPIKPYVPEPPSSAPRFCKAGKYSLLLPKHIDLLTNLRASRLLPMDRQSRRGCT